MCDKDILTNEGAPTRTQINSTKFNATKKKFPPWAGIMWKSLVITLNSSTLRAGFFHSSLGFNLIRRRVNSSITYSVNIQGSIHISIQSNPALTLRVCRDLQRTAINLIKLRKRFICHKSVFSVDWNYLTRGAPSVKICLQILWIIARKQQFTVASSCCEWKEVHLIWNFRVQEV